MQIMAAVTQQRSPTKFAPADWHTANYVIASSSERQRTIAHNVRQQSQRLRNDTENKTRWMQHSTDTLLDQRIGDIHSWRNTLEKTLQDTESEIDKMTEHKERTERAFDAKTMPLDVVIECLSLREHRVSTDLVRDEVEGELHKELEVIEGIRGQLHQKVNQAFEQICVLQECHHQLHADLTDKYSALQIDTESVELRNTSDTITLQTDPTRIKKDIVTPNQWISFSAHNTRQAQEEMQGSVRLREAINHTLQQTTTDLETQWTATNYAFRKRLHEMEQARRELEWQKKNTEAEIREVEEEIVGLEHSLAEKLPPMMVVQTRLENRTFRPNVELCRDSPQYGMVKEVAEIAESQQALQEKLAVAERALGSLQRTLERITSDLAVKDNSLAVDRQCMQTRERLSEHPKAHELTQPPTSTTEKA